MGGSTSPSGFLSLGFEPVLELRAGLTPSREVTVIGVKSDPVQTFLVITIGHRSHGPCIAVSLWAAGRRDREPDVLR
jgi:hypothetical protein